MLNRRTVLGAGAASLVWPGVAQAQAPGGMIGLVIGNAAYGGALARLDNPINDALAVSRTLVACGFEMAPAVENADGGAIRAAVRAFAHRLAAARSDAMGFLFYSGHGAANNEGKNFLIGSGAYPTLDEEVWERSVSIEEVLAVLADAGAGRPQIISIDACRTSLKLTPSAAAAPAPTPTAASPKLRSFSGIKGIEVTSATPVNQFISFSTWEGQFAYDIGRSQVLGPYAEALTRRLLEGGRHVRDMFDDVRLDVLESTVQAQEPMGLVRLARGSRDLVVAPPDKREIVLRQRRSLLQALVVSCSYAGSLPKTGEDADLVGAALESSGFDVVRRSDLRRADLYREIGKLQVSLMEAGPAAVGVVYFAGYGASNAERGVSTAETKNYLLPEGGLVAGSNLEADALSLEKIVGALLPAQAAAVVLLIDCGRPYTATSSKDVEGGFFDQYSSEKVMVAFATEAKQIRPAEYNGELSPYAKALAAEIRKPTRRGLEEMLREVARRVVLDTQGRMTPRLMSTLNEPGRPADPAGSSVPIYFRDNEGLDRESSP